MIRFLATLAFTLSIASTSANTRYLFIGNPGVGKSTILNGLHASHGHGAAAIFHSGMSFGGGMTYQLDVKESGGNLYMDTPGLADVDMRKAAAKAITEALKRGGVYKVFFVIAENHGRVRSEDVTTMSLVLEAAPIKNYGIIVNQMSEKVFAKLQEQSNYDKFMTTLLAKLPTKTGNVLPMPFQASLDGEDDASHTLPQNVLEFIEATPGIDIPKEQVKEVKADDFDAVNEKLEQALEQIRKDNTRLNEEMQKLRDNKQSFQWEALAAALIGGAAEGWMMGRRRRFF